MRTTASIALGLVLASAAAADVRLPAVFGDHMVFQRNRPIVVFGHAQPSEAVSAELRDAAGKPLRTGKAIAGPDGVFHVDLEPLPATADPLVLEVRAANTITVNDVLVGEVWIAGGQSNMEWELGATGAQRDDGVKIANDPLVRFIKAPHVTAPRPAETIDASWKVLDPASAPQLSAVAFWMAMDLRRELGVPVGILSINWGGTDIEPWTDIVTIAAHAPFAERLAKQREAVEAWSMLTDDARNARWREQMKAFGAAAGDWWGKVNDGDPGAAGAWADPAHDTVNEGWRTVTLPGAWSKDAQLADFDGTAWYRRTVEVPKEWDGKECMLELGSIDDADVTYFNGRAIANTVADWSTPRRYRVPKAMVKAGTATIVVEVLDLHGEGGFVGNADSMRLLCPAAGNASIPLAGEWSMHTGRAATTLPPAPARPERDRAPGMSPGDPAAMFNGMIAPFAGYGVAGAIWYQGENNAASQPRAEEYRALLPLLVRSWRTAFGRPDMPFGVVSLAAFRQFTPDAPCSGIWPTLRAAQLGAEQVVPNLGVVTTIDVGDANDIHPRDKRAVGQRLAHWAMATTYGKPQTPWRGPRAKSVARSGSAVDIEFDVEAGRLGTRDGKPVGGIVMVDADGKSTWAVAEVVGSNKLHVPVPAGMNPAFVRYAWQDNPANANLADTVSGLPAHPFEAKVPE